MLDWIVQMMPVAFAISVAVMGWRVARRVLSWIDEPSGLHSIPSGPYSRETPEEALYRARKQRRKAEHSAWDTEFHALAGRDGCAHCGGPSRSSRRAVFF